jgi:hypothetical protein
MKNSPRFALTLGGRLAERGLRSANDVYTPIGTLGAPAELGWGAQVW